MIAILFTVLKILGLILLGILGLVLLVVLLILLVPIRYQAEGSYYGALQAEAGVSWLLHLIHIHAGFRGQLLLWVKICGFKVFSTEEEKTKTEKKNKRRKRRKKKKIPASEPEAAGVRDEKKVSEDDHEQAETDGLLENENPDPLKDENPDPPVNPDEKEVSQEESAKEDAKRSFSFTEFCDKLKSILQRVPKSVRGRICAIFGSFRDKYRMISEKKRWITAFLQNEDNQKTIKLLKRQAIRLIRHVFPRRLRGRVRFGFDDPYTTGQILTWISPFYGLYADKLELIPVFEEKALEGEVSLKGRIRLGTVIFLAVRVLFDRNFRRLLRKLRSRD
jgi:hypothetical protein